MHTDIIVKNISPIHCYIEFEVLEKNQHFSITDLNFSDILY